MAVGATGTMASSADFAGSTSSEQSKNKFSSDMNTFLTMLTTQLKNQDPLSPMDSTEFTNQLVMFSGVEQAIHTNENLESLNYMTLDSMNMAAIGYIGKTIQAEGNVFTLKDSKAKFSYLLSAGAETNGIAIKDADGKLVKTVIGETTKGNHEFVWDGTDNDGNQLEDGTYSFSATPISSDENIKVEVYSTVFGEVTGVASDKATGDMYLSMEDTIVQLGRVLTVRNGID
ncbi:MAG: flagellar hook assembly protein FlgD [Alphaproteobacteria bacterium]|nr:flagellar hook assembly protein FlgD [Alphaproteobacteria bacterium]